MRPQGRPGGRTEDSARIIDRLLSAKEALL